MIALLQVLLSMCPLIFAPFLPAIKSRTAVASAGDGAHCNLEFIDSQSRLMHF